MRLSLPRRGGRLHVLLAISLLLQATLMISCGGQAAAPAPAAQTVGLVPTPAPTPPAPPPAPSAPPLVIMTSSLPEGTSGEPYSGTLAASGGVAPYTWAVAAGNLPGGLNLNASNGAITGAPTAAGYFDFSAQVTDGAGKTRSAAFTITVNPPPNNITHVVIVVEENKGFDEVIGNRADMPYLNSLARSGAVARNYFANVLSSQGDYFMLTVGHTLTDNSSFTGVFSGDNVVRQLIRAGKRWKIYAESIPGVGYTGGDDYPYIKIHNPFAYIDDVLDNADHIVPFSEFADDLANGRLPHYSFVIPNDINDGHSCASNQSCSLEKQLNTTDAWLRDNIGPLLEDPDFKQHGLLLITWDESDGDDTHGGGRVATVLVGAKVKAGYRSDTFFQHQSLLKLSLQALGIHGFPGAAADAPDMLEFFSGPIP